MTNLDEAQRQALDEALGELRLGYCPIYPNSPKQELFLLTDRKEVFFGGAAGPGKMLALDTKVPTPSGWTAMGDLRIGDEVFDEAGKPCTVKWMSDINLAPESYRLTFDDGSTIDACADHLWWTFTAKELSALSRSPEKRARRRANYVSKVSGRKSAKFSASLAERNRLHPQPVLPKPTGAIRTTRRIAETLTLPRGRRNHAIPVASPIECEAADLPLDPYVLGAWLGDGNSSGGHITSADPPLMDEFAQAGWRYRRVPSSKYGYRVEGLTTKLRTMGLINNKHVPAPYLRGSVAQRQALLEGLMDTDGYVDTSGQAQFSSTKEALAGAVHELVASLGMKPTRNTSRAKLYGRDCGPSWSVSWTPTMPVFRLHRKLKRQTASQRRTVKFRYVTGCSPITPVPMRCIQVSAPTGMFLAGETMVPTHNSYGLLMSALQYADVPGYTAILFRPTLTEWHVSGLMTLAQEWLSGTPALWRGDTNTFYFPGGGRLIFGFASNIQDTFRYRSAAFQFIGWDELTSFTEDVYVRLFGRLRRPGKKIGMAAEDGTTLHDIPLRVRSASNPGGIGHAWVQSRFVNPETRYPDALFIPARLEDNPDMDAAAYINSLGYLPASERARLLQGDWDVRDEGELFQYQWLDIVDSWPPGVRSVRYWDLAGTEPSTANSDPDYTVGVKLEIDRDRNFVVRHIVRGRWAPGKVQAVVRQTAEVDGRETPVVIEQDPGQAGVAQVERYKRDVLQGFIAKSQRPTGDKFLRAQPVAAAAENGYLKIVNGPNVREFIDELVSFRPKAVHDDCVDALSGAHSFLAGATVRQMRVGVARGRLPSASDLLAAREIAAI